jgi:hypothetical protein
VCFLKGLGELRQALPADLSGLAAQQDPPDSGLPELSACPVSGKSILVLDDKRLNCASALAQFGPHNETQTFDSYAKFIEALKTNKAGSGFARYAHAG